MSKNVEQPFSLPGGTHCRTAKDTTSDAQAKDRRLADLPIWDLPVRLFHWSMVIVIVIAIATGLFAPAWWLEVHVFAGYALGLLLVFRLAWGFIGGRYSRFLSYPLAPRHLLHHMRALKRKKSPVHAGHNPAGAWMIVALLSTLSALAVSGLLVLGGVKNLGPFAALVNFRTGELATIVHSVLSWSIIALIAFHLLGVFLETRVFHHPLLKAMITGRKPVEPEQADAGGTHARRGVLVFTLSSLFALAIAAPWALKPPSGWHAIATPSTYRSECGDCHDAYHPSLRTAQDWGAILAGLADHFGEDATLDAQSLAEIRVFLTTNAARTFDTEVANRIGLAPSSSYRITDTPYWKKRHSGLAPELFASKAVGSKVNCQACHTDAASGRFNDSAIKLPKGNPS